jgi:hypothetical protein
LSPIGSWALTGRVSNRLNASIRHAVGIIRASSSKLRIGVFSPIITKTLTYEKGGFNDYFGADPSNLFACSDRLTAGARELPDLRVNWSNR